SALGRGAVGFLTGNYGNGRVAERAQSFASDESIREFVSPDYGFKINFPGFPTIARQTLPIAGYQVPYATYTRSIKNDTEVYTVAVGDRRTVPGDDSALSLEGALNGITHTRDGNTLVSSAAAKLGGRDGLEGRYTVPIDGKTYDRFARLVTK